jgi:hypothetical protein
MKKGKDRVGPKVNLIIQNLVTNDFFQPRLRRLAAAAARRVLEVWMKKSGKLVSFGKTYSQAINLLFQTSGRSAISRRNGE